MLLACAPDGDRPSRGTPSTGGTEGVPGGSPSGAGGSARTPSAGAGGTAAGDASLGAGGAGAGGAGAGGNPNAGTRPDGGSPPIDGARPTEAGASAGDASTLPSNIARVFDLSFLHKIEITIAPENIKAVQSRSDTRVSCTFTFDGITLPNSGVRQGGGIYNPAQTIKQRPSLSLKFDQFVPGQKLYGLDKLYLKNQLQDLSKINEHLADEIYRRAGVPASLTAYAVMTINGYVNGIVEIREAVDNDFLRRNFGKGKEQGNLYEGAWLSAGPSDFVDSPTSPIALVLKDEKQEMRTRDDVIALATAIKNTPNATFAAEVSKRMNLDEFITAFATAAVLGDMDSYYFNRNNYYLYDNPVDSRFVIMPHGSDQCFWAEALNSGDDKNRMTTALAPPVGKLAIKVRGIPDLDAKFRAEVKRVGSLPVWDQEALMATIAQAAKLFETAPVNVPTVKADVDAFKKWRPTVESFVKMGGLSNR